MLEIRGVTKTYRTKKGGETHALRGVTLAFPARGLVFLLGKSGSGKSTLLNILGGLDRPDAGELIAYGRSSAHFTEEDFDSYRNTCVGFIFQEYNLLDEFTVEENVALALELQGMKRGTDDARRARARSAESSGSEGSYSSPASIFSRSLRPSPSPFSASAISFSRSSENSSRSGSSLPYAILS